MHRLIIKLLLVSSIFLSITAIADDHASNSDEASQTAFATETSICTFNEGKDVSDMDKVLNSFKSWATETDYPSYLVMNTPLYVSSQTNAQVVLQEFASFQNLATAWKKLWAEDPKFVTDFEKIASCGRSLSHYYPLHNNQNLEPDDDRIMVINWCTKNQGVSWDQMQAKHATFNFSTSIDSFMQAENMRANEGGWKLREDYYASYASCSGANVYQQTVISRPAN